MKFNIYLITIIAFLFASCTTIKSTPTLFSSNEISDQEKSNLSKRWKKHHAFYEFDELQLEQSFIVGMSHPVPTYRVIINQKIKIIDEEGLSFATISLPQYAGRSTKFKFTIFDENNVETKLDLPQKEIISQWKKDQRVVLPNIKPGYSIQVYIKSSGRISSYGEHWLQRKIPVLKSRFSIGALTKSYQYDFQAKGRGLKKTETNVAKGKIFKTTWEAKHVLPFSETPYQGWGLENSPRINWVLRKAKGTSDYHPWQNQFSDWNDIAKEYNTHIYDNYRLSRGQKKHFQQKLDSIFKIEDEFVQSEKILAYVQENYTLDESLDAEDDLDRIIKTKKGPVWEISGLLMTLLELAKVENTILMTRPHNLGAFDPKFVFPPALKTPLNMMTTSKGERLILFPYNREYPVGAYPKSFLELKTIDLNNSQITKIPYLRKSTQKHEFNYTIKENEEEEDWSFNLEIKFYDYSAISFRSRFNSLEKSLQKESIQDILSQRHKQNRLIDYSIIGSESNDDVLTINIRFANDDIFIERKGEVLINLDPFFRTYFSKYETTRVENLVNLYEEDVQENLSIQPRSSASNFKLKLLCPQLKNELFESECYQEIKENEVLIERVIRFNKYSAKPRIVNKQVHPDLIKMNKIEGSNLKWKIKTK